jgi:hypothetical protein
MTEITEENFLDIMLGPGSDDEGSDNDHSDHDSPSGNAYRYNRHDDDDNQNDEEEEDEDGAVAATTTTTATTTQNSLPPRAPAVRDHAVRETMSLIERDIMEAEAALARRHRVRGEY